MVKRFPIGPTIFIGRIIGEDKSFDLSLIPPILYGLRPKEYCILTMRWGLNGKPPMTFTKIGQIMHLSGGRVSQLENRFWIRLRTVKRCIEGRIK